MQYIYFEFSFFVTQTSSKQHNIWLWNNLVCESSNNRMISTWQRGGFNAITPLYYIKSVMNYFVCMNTQLIVLVSFSYSLTGHFWSQAEKPTLACTYYGTQQILIGWLNGMHWRESSAVVTYLYWKYMYTCNNSTFDFKP